jgi:ribonuclease VapC
VIVDSSAVVAILLAEPEAAACAKAIENSPDRRISAVNYVEAAIVIDGRGDPMASARFDDLLREASIQAKFAREAYRTFGRGSGHPARLNLGDCFAYALARRRGEALLFKGNDFVHTDINPALA